MRECLKPLPPPMMRTLAAVLLLSSLVACVAVADPVPSPDGSYWIDSAGDGYDDDGYQQATRFCFDQGKQLVRLAPSPAGTGPADGGELHFRCAGPGEPGWKEPVG